MFKYFKLKKKRKIENKLNKFILFNKWKMECYKKYPTKIEPPIKEFSDYIACLAMGYDESLWEYFRKYNVKRELFDRQKQSCDMALNAERKLRKRIEEDKFKKEEREKINLYKKAILELREEKRIL